MRASPVGLSLDIRPKAGARGTMAPLLVMGQTSVLRSCYLRDGQCVCLSGQGRVTTIHLIDPSAIRAGPFDEFRKALSKRRWSVAWKVHP
jgi:hypothetical protein